MSDADMGVGSAFAYWDRKLKARTGRRAPEGRAAVRPRQRGE